MGSADINTDDVFLPDETLPLEESATPEEPIMSERAEEIRKERTTLEAHGHCRS